MADPIFKTVAPQIKTEQEQNFDHIQNQLENQKQSLSFSSANSLIPAPVAKEQQQKLSHLENELQAKNGKLTTLEVGTFSRRFNDIRAAQLFFFNEFRDSVDGKARLVSDERFRSQFEAEQAKSQTAIAITENNKITTAQKLEQIDTVNHLDSADKIIKQMESWGYNWADVLKVADLFVSKQANLMTLNFNTAARLVAMAIKAKEKENAAIKINELTKALEASRIGAKEEIGRQRFNEILNHRMNENGIVMSDLPL